MPEPKRQFIFQVVYPDNKVDTFHIGPHTPSLKTEDVHLVHRLWLNITREPGLETLHHHDILTEALTRFAREYAGHDRQDILRELRKQSGLTVTSGRLGERRRRTDQGQRTPPRRSQSADAEKTDDGPPTPPVVGP